jgi:hypothetical protein
MADKWVGVSLSADVEHNVLRIMAVDSKGDIWMLIKQGDAVVRDTVLHQARDVWVLLTPPHP